MPTNFARAMKDEIARICRKEMKAQIQAVRRSTNQHRQDIAELKRQVKELAEKVRILEKEEKKRMAGPPPTRLAEGARFSPRWLRSHRNKLGLSGADYARLVGVHPMTIYNWEHGKSKPRKEQLAALVAVRDLKKREAQKRLDFLDE